MTRLTGLRVLVTGAGGFIGRHLVASLVAEGAHVIGVVSPGRASAEGAAEVLEIDLARDEAVPPAIARASPAAIVHLAAGAYHAGDPLARSCARRVAVGGTAGLIEGARRAGCVRLVNVGSSLEYGPARVPLAESHPLAPVTFRGAIKAAQSLLAHRLGDLAGLEVVTIRPFSVYGPLEPAGRLMPTAVRAALTGEAMRLKRGPAHDFVEVSDVVEACVRALIVPDVGGQVFNVGTGRQTRNEEVITLISAIVGREIRVSADAHAGSVHDAGHWVADTRHAERMLGFRARVSLREGIERLVARTAARVSARDVTMAAPLR